MALNGKMLKYWVLDSQLYDLRKCLNYSVLRFFSDTPAEGTPKFSILKIQPEKPRERKRTVKERKIEARADKMSVDQDWSNVWPGPRNFHPASVPLPIRQGKTRRGPPPGKFCNTELMKIPNFLHLTPPAILKHCKAIRKFCTKWPDHPNINHLFPIEIIYSDYCHSGPTIRNPLSRIVTLRFQLKALKFDQHALDKFLRLVGKRYNPETGYVTITTDNCPLKKQNYDYAHYLLTALYYESWKFEDWEKTKSDDDMEEYRFWERQSSRNVKSLFEYNNEELPDTKSFEKAVSKWHDQGDNPQIIENYKTEVCKLLKLPAPQNEVAAAN